MRNFLNETLSIERFVIQILKEKFKDIEHISAIDPQAEYDILADRNRIDVKYASPTFTSRKKKVPIWDFDLRKGEHKDKFHRLLHYFVCVGMKHNTPQKVFMIPFDESPKMHLRISPSGGSKYNKDIIWEREK